MEILIYHFVIQWIDALRINIILIIMQRGVILHIYNKKQSSQMVIYMLLPDENLNL